MLSSADFKLVRRLELGHADSGLSYAQAYRERYPDSVAAFEQIAGGWAIFMGADSPLTQALAIGASGALTAEEWGRLQHFFHSRGAAAVIDLSSMADASVMAFLQERGLTIREISGVLARSISRDEVLAANPAVEVEGVPEGAMRDWARLAVRGFSERDEVSENEVDIVSAAPAHLLAYFARLGSGERTAVAGMTVAAGLATLFGDATLPKARRSGLQLALIVHRLQKAAEMGCDLASASVLPGSSSHRNYERAGFQLIYSRIQVSIPR
jgi:GNAT superfamily N-acetyltransferase